MTTILQAVGRSQPFVKILPLPRVTNRAPDTTDISFPQGQLWINESTSPPEVYIHTGGGVWIESVGGAGFDQITTDNGVGIAVANNMNIIGGTNVQTSAVGNTITIDFSGAAAGASTFNADTGQALEVGGAISILGGTGIDTAGSGSTITVDVSSDIASSYSGDTGSAIPAGNVLTIAGGNGISSTGAGSTLTIDLDSPVTVPNGGTGATSLTDGGIMLGSGTNPVKVTVQPTDGQLLIGFTGSDPLLNTLSSGDGSVNITPGPGLLDLSVPATGTNTFNTDSTPAQEVGGAIDILGGTGLTTSGAGSAVTIDLDVPVTVTNGGTGATTLTDGGIVLGSGTNPVTVTAQPTDGQLLIGSTGLDPVLSTLTSGDGSVLITPGPGTIDLSAVAGAFPWLLAPGPTQVLAVNTGYIGIATTLPVPANITYTLPVASATGDIIEITNIGGDLPIIAQNATQSIRFTASQTTVGVGGSLTAVDQFSSIRLLCTIANTDWMVLSHTGNWVVV